MPSPPNLLVETLSCYTQSGGNTIRERELAFGGGSGTRAADVSFENWNHRRATPHYPQASDLDFAKNTVTGDMIFGEMEANGDREDALKALRVSTKVLCALCEEIETPRTTSQALSQDEQNKNRDMFHGPP